jgi:hypothetical protein
MTEEMNNDEYRPACPKCAGNSFIAVQNRSIIKADNSPVMIICSNISCQTIVGMPPRSDVWDD